MKFRIKSGYLAIAIALTNILTPVYADSHMSKTRVVPIGTNDHLIAETIKADKALPDGFYLIQREGPTAKQLEPLGDKERSLVYDYEFIAPNERGETSYVVVNNTDYIPLLLKNSPVKESDQNGRPKLSISLSDDQVVPLENFTRKNVDKSVAIIIGGKVVTTHRIRVPIIGGKMQITRCTDHGCESLYTQLQKRDLTR